MLLEHMRRCQVESQKASISEDKEKPSLWK